MCSNYDVNIFNITNIKSTCVIWQRLKISSTEMHFFLFSEKKFLKSTNYGTPVNGNSGYMNPVF